MMIRGAQLRQLAGTRERAFEGFVMALLHEQVPERCALVSDDELRNCIRKSTARSQKYGIGDENSIAKFVYLTWLLGEGFEDAPQNLWLGSLIRDGRRPAVDRMEIAMSGVVYHFEHETGSIPIEE